MLLFIEGLPFTRKHDLATRLVTEFNFTSVSVHPQEPAPDALAFASIADLTQFVTSHWQADFVLVATGSGWPQATSEDIDALFRRPFVAVVRLEDSMGIRVKRMSAAHPNDAVDLEKFIQQDDALLHPTESIGLSRHALTKKATVVSRFHDNFNVQALLSDISVLLRPGWDDYFMLLASLASRRSNCMKRRVGAVLVLNGRVLSTGYNGTARASLNCNEGGCPVCNQHMTGELHGVHMAGFRRSVQGMPATSDPPAHECVCLHAEENALLEAGLPRLGGGDKAVLYCNTCPCLKCAIKIIQCSIQRVVYSLSYSMDDATKRLFENAGVRLHQIQLPSFPIG